MNRAMVHDTNGVSWHEAPLPWRWHRCQAWTLAVVTSDDDESLTFIDRCRCGAIRINNGDWFNRNIRINSGERRHR